MNAPGRTTRSPLDLHQEDENQGISCVSAQVLHLAGVCPAVSPAAVDRRVQRRRESPAEYSAIERLLLEFGLSLHNIGPYDPHKFLTQGIDYLREFHKEEWDQHWEDWFRDPERLERHRRECRDHLAIMRDFPQRMSEECRQPTVGDMRSALRSRSLVMVLFENGSGVTCRSVLLTSLAANGGFNVYVPTFNPWPCLRVYSEVDLRRVWLRDSAITVIRV